MTQKYSDSCMFNLHYTYGIFLKDTTYCISFSSIKQSLKIFLSWTIFFKRDIYLPRFQKNNRWEKRLLTYFRFRAQLTQRLFGAELTAAFILSVRFVLWQQLPMPCFYLAICWRQVELPCPRPYPCVSCVPAAWASLFNQSAFGTQ